MHQARDRWQAFLKGTPPDILREFQFVGRRVFTPDGPRRLSAQEEADQDVSAALWRKSVGWDEAVLGGLRRHCGHCERASRKGHCRRHAAL